MALQGYSVTESTTGTEGGTEGGQNYKYRDRSTRTTGTEGGTEKQD